MGVTSRMLRMPSPLAASAWMALSRPLPGPCTYTCTRFTPSCSASRAACSAATVAANGVLFLLPLKPALPALPHTTELPAMSVMLTSVLLNVAFTWAMPSLSTWRLVLGRPACFGFAMRMSLLWVRGLPRVRYGSPPELPAKWSSAPACAAADHTEVPSAQYQVPRLETSALGTWHQVLLLLLARLLLAGDRPARALLGARIGVRA